MPVRPTGDHSRRSPSAFSARSFETFCSGCEVWFTFEMGSLLDVGIDPASLRWFDAPCPNQHRVRVTPHDVWELI